MKLNPVNFLIAIAVAAVISYGFWSLGGELAAYVGIGAFVFCAATLTPAIGFSYAQPRRAVNLRMVCFVFMVLALVINAVFALLPLSVTAYVVVSLLAFLAYAFLANSVYAIKQ